jgi:excisionase family DNA binding protein
MTGAWMNPEQAAAATGFSTKTIYRALWDGELIATKRRRRWLIRPEALTNWVENEPPADVPRLIPKPSHRTRTPRSTPRGTLGQVLADQNEEAA